MRSWIQSAANARRRVLFGAVLAAAALIGACATSPLGRNQLILLPAAQMDQMGITAYQQMKSEQPLNQDGVTNNYVLCVANALLTSMDNNPGNWEVNVFMDGSANAFALPGGKIGVNSGLLKVARSQDQLAAVIGHEIGHVIAQHSNERMSIQYATQTGMQMLQALSGEASPEKQQLFALLGLGSQVGIALPFSRKHEAEADLIGLQLMAKAGFDPRQSVTLWQNMAAANGSGGLEFLSTHPANDTRINGLQANMDEALALYEQARNAGRVPRCR